MLSILFFLSIAALLSFYFYGTFINYFAKRNIERKYQTPPLSIIVPCRNEEKNIAEKIENLLSQNYPKNSMEIIIVDNESTDITAEIAKKFPVTVLSAPRGKINAINKGIEEARTDVIAITDADTKLSHDAIKNAVSLLHGKVGAVNGMTQVLKKKNWYMDGKLKYHKKDWMLRYKESLIDSCCSLDGKLIVFKKSLVRKIPSDAYIDDFELTLMIRKKGFRCIVDESACVFEPPAINIKEEVKQMRRRTMHTILTIFRHVDMLFNKKYGYYGMLVLPFRRFLPLFTPFFITIIFVYSIFILKIWAVPFFAVITAFFFATRKSTFYFIILIVAIVFAWYDVFLMKTKKGANFERINN